MTKKPNIVFLLYDHQAFYGHGKMVNGPKIKQPNFEKFATQGIEFTNAYTCCPLCAPARRSMLTGLFPHTHGEYCNVSFHEFDKETYLSKLAEAGYKNYYYGKWHAGPGTAYNHHCEGFSYPDYNNPYTKPEYKKYLKMNNLPPFEVKIERNFFDFKAGPLKGLSKILAKGKLWKSIGPACNEHAMGVMTTPKETHESFFLASLVCNKLKEIYQENSNQPFHLRVDFWGPHQPYFATKEFLDMYPPDLIPEHPSFQDDLKNKPEIYRSEYNHPLNHLGKLIIPNPLPWSEWQKILAFCYAQQTLIDEAVGLILKALDKYGFFDNTLVVWTTDHGDAVACHGGHFDKCAYMPEEMLRIPFVLRYPGVIPAGQKSEKLVSNLDLGPTFLDVAGNSFSNPVHGKSILPISSNKETEWRKDLMCETNGHNYIHLGRAIVTNQYKYIWNFRDMDELYDLKNDPYEMNNLINNQDFASVLADLKYRLENWRKKTNDNITTRELRKDRVDFIRNKSELSTLTRALNR